MHVCIGAQKSTIVAKERWKKGTKGREVGRRHDCAWEGGICLAPKAAGCKAKLCVIVCKLHVII